MKTKIGAVLKVLLKVAGKNDIRYYFNGVHVYRNDNSLVMEATDGHRLMRVKCVNPDVYTAFNVGTDVVIERSTLERALKMGVDMELRISDTQVTYGGVELSTHDCEYPDTDIVISCAGGSKPDAEKGVDAEMMMSTCCAIRDLLKAHKSKFITSKVSQTASDIQFVWSGDAADGELIYTAHLMPCRV